MAAPGTFRERCGRKKKPAEPVEAAQHCRRRIARWPALAATDDRRQCFHLLELATFRRAAAREMTERMVFDAIRGARPALAAAAAGAPAGAVEEIGAAEISVALAAHRHPQLN
jgi:hypothetical protein